MNLRSHLGRSPRTFATLVVLPLAVLASSLTPGLAAAADQPQALPGTVPVAGATIVGEQWLTARTLGLTVETPSFISQTHVEVMFPTGYDDASTRRWPVTYYLNGTNGNQTWFRTNYNGEAETASYPSLVVTPSGDAGYWSDWYNDGAGGPPMYETFVTQQLIPLIDANYRTLPDRAHRAILGESMGGYGTMMIAARHPDLFAAASSLSGAPDTKYTPGAAILAVSPAIDVAPPDSIYGPRSTEEVRWRGHNPTDLTANLRDVDLQLYTGNGVPAIQEATAPPFLCAVESGVIAPETQSLHNTLTDLGIAHSFTALNWGCHTPVMFQQEIADTLPRFAALFATPRPAPSRFDYRSTEPAIHVYDWSVAADPNRAPEFLDLRDVNDTGLTITGSGTTTVTTPPLFQGSAPVTVTSNAIMSKVRPDSAGRITFTVDLGPADQQQEYTSGAVTNLHTAGVTFARQ